MSGKDAQWMPRTARARGSARTGRARGQGPHSNSAKVTQYAASAAGDAGLGPRGRAAATAGTTRHREGYKQPSDAAKKKLEKEFLDRVSKGPVGGTPAAKKASKKSRKRRSKKDIAAERARVQRKKRQQEERAHMAKMRRREQTMRAARSTPLPEDLQTDFPAPPPPPPLFGWRARTERGARLPVFKALASAAENDEFDDEKIVLQPGQLDQFGGRKKKTRKRRRRRKTRRRRRRSRRRRRRRTRRHRM